MAIDPITGAAAIAGIGGLMSANSASRNARADRRFQERMAKNSVQWRVHDAELAGLHPLAALGMSPNQANPTMVGADPGQAVTKVANMMYDAQMQEAVSNSKEAKAKANYYNAMADDVRKAKVTGGNLVGNEVIVPGLVQNKPQVLQTPLGTHSTGKAVPQERMEQEYGGVIGEGYGIIRAYDDFVRKPINRKANKYVKELKKKAKQQKRRGQMNRRRNNR